MLIKPIKPALLRNLDRYSVVLVPLLLLWAAGCTPARPPEIVTMESSGCEKEYTAPDADKYAAESADNLTAMQEGALLRVVFEARIRNSKNPAVTVERVANQVRLYLRYEPQDTGNKVCLYTLSTAIANLEPGTYSILVMDSGKQLPLAFWGEAEIR